MRENETERPPLWLGATVEDKLRYRKRFSIIARIPATVRFLSFEPGLGPLGPLDILLCSQPVEDS